MQRRWRAWLAPHRRALAWQIGHRWERTPIGVRFSLTLISVIITVFIPLTYLSIYLIQKITEEQNRISQMRLAKQAEQILERELLGQLIQTEDYSVWNDARTAMLQRDHQWLRTYLVDWIIQHFDYDQITVLGLQNQVLVSNSDDSRWVCDTSTVQQAQRGVGGAELARYGDHIYLLSATPICDEQWSKPHAGVLVMVKRLDEAYLSHIAEQLGGSATLYLNPTGKQQPSQQAVAHSIMLRDSVGTPIANLVLAMSNAEARGGNLILQNTKRYLIGMVAAVALTSSVTMVFFLRRHLAGFSAALNRLAAGNWDTRVPYAARDEFGYLARAFNMMAYQLQQAFKEQERQREQIQAQNKELQALYQQLQTANRELAQLNAELTEANRALAQAAITDGLTGLKNHRAFQEALHSLGQMAERLRQPLTLIMFDIDHFKQFNDSFGHPAGDELLRQVAQVLRDSARAYDVAARYGGEEFALLLPNTTLEQAVQVAERLLGAIQAIKNPHRAISASFGVAIYRFGTPPATLLYEADAALYRAKRNGRAQVCIYQPDAA
ncbi:MAG: hypothetical protein KatS3mg019_2416 [Fimbriimonadales bacterium]|nr:MAG: hypothetical protein KatS3mg019_2416 [Fimbriimonadales bacterium]